MHDDRPIRTVCQRVFISNAEADILVVEFRGGLARAGCEKLVRPFAVLALSNLTYSNHDNRYNVCTRCSAVQWLIRISDSPYTPASIYRYLAANIPIFRFLLTKCVWAAQVFVATACEQTVVSASPRSVHLKEAHAALAAFVGHAHSSRSLPRRSLQGYVDLDDPLASGGCDV